MKKFYPKAVTAMLCMALLLATFLAGCKEPQTEAADSAKTPEKTAVQTEKIVLNEVAHSIFYTPLYVAIENGYFAEQGIDLELVTGFGADHTMAALLSGEADIGFMGPETTVYAHNEGASDKIVNFAQLTQRAGNFLVAREPMEDFTWNMLKGASVLGGRDGGMPEMVFEYVLKKHGLDPNKDLSINKNIDFGSTAAAFSGGQGDYTVEFEPAATALEQEQAGYVVSSLGIESGYVPYTAFSAKESYLKEHPELISAFVAALQQGMDYVAHHTTAEIANVISPQFPDTDADTLAAIVSRYAEQDSWKADLRFQKDSYELLLDILEDAGQLEARPDYDVLVTTEYIQ